MAIENLEINDHGILGCFPTKPLEMAASGRTCEPNLQACGMGWLQILDLQTYIFVTSEPQPAMNSLCNSIFYI